MQKKRQPITPRQLILASLAVGIVMFLVVFGSAFFLSRDLVGSLLSGVGAGFLFGLAAFAGLYIGE